MDKEKLKALLEELPDEDYLDKLIDAVNLWVQHKDQMPDEYDEYLDKVIEASRAEVEEHYEGYLDKVIEASRIEPGHFEQFPDEDYLNKLIQASQIEPGSLA